MTRVAVARPVPIVLAMMAAVAALAVWVVFAAPAGASSTFSSGLTAAEPIAKVVVPDSAPFTEDPAPKKMAKAKAVKRYSTAPGARTIVRTASSSGELAEARRLLAAQIRKHPILKGTTVEFGDARGYQAIAYYGSGRIVISKNHRASLERIIGHEVWHIIDWRDNGRIDWGESVPPR